MKDFERQFKGIEVFLNEGKDKQNNAKVASITADEFQIQFKKLRRKMTQFWAKEDKVACLKICIQCAKLLNDTETPAFYPLKFLIITEIMDDFGKMVFDRMKKLSFQEQGITNWENILDNEIDFRNTPDFVKEKTNNWFLK
jgi:hypothetical protein